MKDFVEILETKFKMGSHINEGFPQDKEGPQVDVDIGPFAISKFTVTNKDFHKFVLDTAYITEAELHGSSNVFHLLLTEEQKEKAKALPNARWWYEVEDASWRMPEGRGSSIKDRMDHPVVHVTWNDAMAFCKWSGYRLPTEAEWELASRAGHKNLRFPWGDELEKDGKMWANTWQGDFPDVNTEKDGYLGTAPVESFQANDFGIYQMIGNVWEWCLNDGRIELKEFASKSTDEFIAENKSPTSKLKALRGGSFLCHKSHCTRYRNAGRNSNLANASTSNTGFRVAKSL